MLYFSTGNVNISSFSFNYSGDLLMVKYYAREHGWHYHTDLNCMMIAGQEFKIHGYKEITLEEVKRRKLSPCACATELYKCLKN